MSKAATRLLLRRRSTVPTPPPPGPGGPFTLTSSVGFGDSLTAQTGYIDAIQDELSLIYGRTVLCYREGRGSQRSEGIAARQGGRPALANALTIPANGSITITFSNHADFLNNYDGNPEALVCTLGGVAGTLTKQVTPGQNNVDCWPFKFNRIGSGAATPITAGTPLLFEMSTFYRPMLQFIRPGHNNRPKAPNTWACTGGYDNLGSLTTVPATDGPYHHAIQMRDYCNAGGGYGIVVSLQTADPAYLGSQFAELSADVTSVNSAWATAVGGDYCNLRAYLSSKQALVDGGVISASQNPSIEDQKGIDQLYPPRSFQQGIHLNDTGQRVAGRFLARFAAGRIGPS